MVKLNKIYTRTGDDGTTGLADGTRRAKHDLRIDAYGTVDEANAAIGLAVIACRDSAEGLTREIGVVLESVQHDMFDAGADLATPVKAGENPAQRLRIQKNQTDRLEGIIDRFNEPLAPLNSFVLPGGTAAAAALHLARTITRRAERLVVQLVEREPEQTSPETVRYLNRLSDLLFVLARAANSNGKADVLWVPGANRSRP